MNEHYLQSEKTIYNIKKKYDYSKDNAIDVVTWEEVEIPDKFSGNRCILDWEDKVELFETYIPTPEITKEHITVYIIIESKQDEGRLVWVELNKQYQKEWFFWLFAERLRKTDAFIKTLETEYKNVIQERARKKLDKYIDDMARAKFDMQNDDDERSFEDIKEELREAVDNV